MDTTTTTHTNATTITAVPQGADNNDTSLKNSVTESSIGTINDEPTKKPLNDTTPQVDQKKHKKKKKHKHTKG